MYTLLMLFFGLASAYFFVLGSGVVRGFFAMPSEEFTAVTAIFALSGVYGLLVVAVRQSRQRRKLNNDS